MDSSSTGPLGECSTEYNRISQRRISRRASNIADSIRRRLSPLSEGATSVNWLQWLLGLAPGNDVWGIEDPDFWPISAWFVKGLKKEEWYQMAEQHAHSHGAPTWWDTPWRKVPTVRHLWGETQTELHAGAQELFLDLIFVGVAFRCGSVLKASFYACAPDSDAALGHGSHDASSAARRVMATVSDDALPPCIGIGVGLLHALAPFMCMYLLWQLETAYRARFRSESKLHIMCDLATNLLLLIAAMNLPIIQSYRGEPSSVSLAAVLIPIVVNLGIWTARTAEIAFFSARECARRQCAHELFVGLQIAAMWVVAIVLIQVDRDSTASSMRSSDIAAGLMWAGNLWWYIQSFCRPLKKLWIRGTHLPLEQSAVCTNVGFTTHRNNEFMFLMLGETVLQVAVSDDTLASEPESLGAKLFSEKTATATFSFILAVSLMFSFRQMVVKQLSSYAATNEGTKDVVKTQQNVISAMRESRRIRENGEKLGEKLERVRRQSAKLEAPPPVLAKLEAPPPVLAKLEDEKPLAPRRAATTQLEYAADKMHTKPVGKGKLSIRDLAAHHKQINDILKSSEISMAYEGVAQRLLLRARMINVIFTFMWQTKALNVMLVGVGVKLAMYDPIASPSAHFGLQQRLLLGVVVTFTFGIQLFNVLCLRNRHLYTGATLRKHRTHATILGVRILLIGVKIGVCFAPMYPVHVLGVLAAFGVLECALLHMMEYRYPIQSNRRPYTADMPAALNALRLKAQRARMNGVPRGLRGVRTSAGCRFLARARVASLDLMSNVAPKALTTRVRRMSASRTMPAPRSRLGSICRAELDGMSTTPSLNEMQQVAGPAPHFGTLEA